MPEDTGRRLSFDEAHSFHGVTVLTMPPIRSRSGAIHVDIKASTHPSIVVRIFNNFQRTVVNGDGRHYTVRLPSGRTQTGLKTAQVRLMFTAAQVAEQTASAAANAAALDAQRHAVKAEYTAYHLVGRLKAAHEARIAAAAAAAIAKAAAAFIGNAMEVERRRQEELARMRAEDEAMKQIRAMELAERLREQNAAMRVVNRALDTFWASGGRK